MWNIKKLSEIPKFREIPSFSKGKIKAIFYEGLPFMRKETEVFAYMGIPESENRVPGVVLVHGGGGTAFYEWVEIWNKKGYAAISMDLCGCIPEKENEKWKKHKNGGPDGWDKSFSQIDREISDQWPFHAISDIKLANTLLSSFPEVDESKIGITGISWGGYLTCIAAGVDSRFKFAIPVYGCGFLMETKFFKNLKLMKDYKREKWLKLWDPANYLDKVTMPMFWINGTNDSGYSLSAFQKSYNLTKGKNTLSIKVRMPHSHQDGWHPEEIYVFADSICKGGTPLPEIKNYGIERNIGWVEFESEIPVVKAELNFTKDNKHWRENRWEILPAEIKGKRAKAKIPYSTKAFYFNITDRRNLVVSSPHIEI